MKVFARVCSSESAIIEEKTITVILWTKLKVVGRTRKTRLAWSNKIGYFQ